MMSGRGILAVVAAGGLAVSLASVAPAGAGVEWSDPQQDSSDYGRQVAVSADGEMAAWIRIAGSSRRGPVLTARYRGVKKGWVEILTRIDLSQDGSTVAWMDPAARFVSSERRTDGSWSPPTLIQGYPDDVLDKQIVIELHLSQDGSRVGWQSPSGVLTSTKSPAGWTPVDYVMQDEPSAVAMSPNGKVIAYGLSLSDTVAVKRFVSGKWSKQERLGPAKFPVLVVRNKAVAWLRSSFGPSRLRVSLLRKGKWTKPVTVAKQARPPGLSSKADTLVWADRKSGDIRSISR